MKLATSVVVLLALVLSACDSGGTAGHEDPDPVDDSTLRGAAAARGFFVGAAVGTGLQRTDARYAATLGREFNMLTPENTMKWGNIHPGPTTFDWTEADALVDHADGNDMQVRGHALLWHQTLPGWVSGTNWERAALVAAVQEHIAAVVGRYKGRIDHWDVVNEAIADGNGQRRETVFQEVIGDEYIALAFAAAHQADPDVKLFYNDYSAEALGTKSDAVYNLAQDLLNQGIPIHGVGLQMHVTAENPPSLSQVRQNIRRLGDLGLIVHITEMDVRIPIPASETDLVRQAQVYHDILDVCLDEPACEALVFWGMTDRYSWVPNFFQGFGAALPFDEEYEPKLAYHVMLDRLRN